MGLDALFVLLGEEEPYSEAVRELMKWEHEKEADFNASADKPWKSSARDIEEVVNGIVQTMRNYETSVTDQCSDTTSHSTRNFNLGAIEFLSHCIMMFTTLLKRIGLPTSNLL